MKEYKVVLAVVLSIGLVGAGIFLYKYSVPKPTDFKAQSPSQSSAIASGPILISDETMRDLGAVTSCKPDTWEESTNVIPAGWKTYRNEKYGFTFSYPVSLSQIGLSASEYGLYVTSTVREQEVHAKGIGGIASTPLSVRAFFPEGYIFTPNQKTGYEYPVSFVSFEMWDMTKFFVSQTFFNVGPYLSSSSLEIDVWDQDPLLVVGNYDTGRYVRASTTVAWDRGMEILNGISCMNGKRLGKSGVDDLAAPIIKIDDTFAYPISYGPEGGLQGYFVLNKGKKTYLIIETSLSSEGDLFVSLPSGGELKVKAGRKAVFEILKDMVKTVRLL